MLRCRRALANHAYSRYVSSCGKFDYDLFTIGAGSGGVRASRIAAGHGASVGVADDLAVGLGGTCVNVGCVPKKLFAYGSELPTEVKDGEGFGWNFTSQAPPDWQSLIQNKDKEIARLNGIYEKLLAGAGCDVHKSRAELVDNHTISLFEGSKTVTAAKILVAVGGWPSMPDIPGKEHLISSNEAFYLKNAPKHAVIAGAGYIAVEFAGIFHGYGAHVDLCIRKKKFLRGFDDDIAAFLQEQMIQQGVSVRPCTQIQKVEEAAGKEGWFDVTFDNGETVQADVVMSAIGRRPKLEGIGLDRAGVETSEKGFIKVDRYQRTNVHNIFALGDCTDTLQLTPAALAEGHCFADTQFGGNERFADLEDVATAVFSHPNIGTVGLSEKDAEKKYGHIKVFKSDFRPLKHTMTQSTERSIMKIIVDAKSDRVVGMHMVGAHAGEMMQGFAAAIKCHITKKQLDSVIGIHPTSAEEFVTMRTMAYEKGKVE
mmetsp:Transcript_24344/g.39233  ORF Transcript_24344/g.39233 Transcript_24344/m.39233 type:complete len:484 (-) Transcript_24344:150-1601(-)